MHVKHDRRGNWTVDLWETFPISKRIEHWENIPWDQDGKDHGYGTFAEALELVKVFKQEFCNDVGEALAEPMILRLFNRRTKKAIIIL